MALEHRGRGGRGQAWRSWRCREIVPRPADAPRPSESWTKRWRARKSSRAARWGVGNCLSRRIRRLAVARRRVGQSTTDIRTGSATLPNRSTALWRVATYWPPRIALWHALYTRRSPKRCLGTTEASSARRVPSTCPKPAVVRGHSRGVVGMSFQAWRPAPSRQLAALPKWLTSPVAPRCSSNPPRWNTSAPSGVSVLSFRLHSSSFVAVHDRPNRLRPGGGETEQTAYPNTAARNWKACWGQTPHEFELRILRHSSRGKKPQVRAWLHPAEDEVEPARSHQRPGRFSCEGSQPRVSTDPKIRQGPTFRPAPSPLVRVLFVGQELGAYTDDPANGKDQWLTRGRAAGPDGPVGQIVVDVTELPAPPQVADFLQLGRTRPPPSVRRRRLRLVSRPDDGIPETGRDNRGHVDPAGHRLQTHRRQSWRDNTGLHKYYLNRGFQYLTTRTHPIRKAGALFEGQPNSAYPPTAPQR